MFWGEIKRQRRRDGEKRRAKEREEGRIEMERVEGREIGLER